MPIAVRAISRISDRTGGPSTYRAGARPRRAASRQRPAGSGAAGGRRRPSRGGSRCAPSRVVLHKPLFESSADENEITGRFVNPAPRRRLFDHLGAATPALVVCGHVHQYRATESAGARHVWGTSTAFVIPDRLQPRYGIKEVGYVEHTLRPDGTHHSLLVRVPGVTTLNIADFPEAYGPI